MTEMTFMRPSWRSLEVEMKNKDSVRPLPTVFTCPLRSQSFTPFGERTRLLTEAVLYTVQGLRPDCCAACKVRTERHYIYLSMGRVWYFSLNLKNKKRLYIRQGGNMYSGCCRRYKCIL